MRFYLHMSGDGIGTLSIFMKSEGNLYLLLNVTGDQGNYWQMREIPLSYSTDFQVVFEGKVGRSPKGDICLDDITFSPGCLITSSEGLEDSTPLPPAGKHSTTSPWFCFVYSELPFVSYLACLFFSSLIPNAAFSLPPLDSSMHCC